KAIEQAAEGIYEKQFWAAAVYFPKETRDSFERFEGILDACFFFFIGDGFWGWSGHFFSYRLSVVGCRLSVIGYRFSVVQFFYQNNLSQVVVTVFDHSVNISLVRSVFFIGKCIV